MRKWGYWENVKMCKCDGTTVLDKQVESGAITPAERKAIGR